MKKLLFTLCFLLCTFCLFSQGTGNFKAVYWAGSLGLTPQDTNIFCTNLPCPIGTEIFGNNNQFWVKQATGWKAIGSTTTGTVTNVTATSPLFVTSPTTTPNLTIQVATTSQNGYITNTDWNTFNNKQGTITLTTTGTSGAATLISNTLNIPNYATSGASWLLASGGTLTGGNTIAFTNTNFVKFQFNNIGGSYNGVSYGLWLQNSTAATNVSNQVAPSLGLEGNIWYNLGGGSANTNSIFNLVNTGAQTELWFKMAGSYTLGGWFLHPINNAQVSGSVHPTGGQFVWGDGTIPSASISSTNAGIVIARTYSGTTAFGSGHGFADVSVINIGGTSSYNSFDVKTQFQVAQTYDHNAGFQFRPAVAGAAFALQYGFIDQSTISAGSVTNWHSFFADDINSTGGTVTTRTGLYVNTLTTGTNIFPIYLKDTHTSIFSGSLSVGIGGTSQATSLLQLGAGTATAGTAPLKFTSGTNLSTTEAGAIEYDGSHLYFTAVNAGTRYQLDQQSGTVAGSNTQIQFNNSGSFGASTGLTFTTTGGNTNNLILLSPDASQNFTVANQNATSITTSLTNSTSGAQLQLVSSASTSIVSNGILVLNATTGVNASASPYLQTKHLLGLQTSAPTIAAGAGAGTSPTVTLSNASDLSGIVNVTTGTTPGTSGVVATITFNSSYAVAPNIILYPHNATTASIAVVSMVYTTSTTTTFVINSNTVALAGSTAYSWYYEVVQ